MIDIQNQEDTRNVPLQKVGVKGVKYPVTVLDKQHKSQHTTATVDLFVNLPHNFKGTHMSRFIEIFHKHHHDITMNCFLEMLSEIRTRLDAQKAYGKIEFPFFVEKAAPVSGEKAIMSYTCCYEAEVSQSEEENQFEKQFFVSIEVPVTTVCPCSKAISEYGAHNQRGLVKVRLLYNDFFWIEDIITLIENSASNGLYSLLKRKDEKYVTEHAYENPRFVEDVVRETYLALKAFHPEKPFKYFSVECTNAESIHNHDAYAFTEYRA